MQVSGSIIWDHSKAGAGGAGQSKELPRGVYKHSGDAALRVLRTEGFRAYWAGYGAVGTRTSVRP